MLNPQVDQFLAAKGHALDSTIQAMRRLILEAQPELIENIKWNAPNYSHRGADRITFNLSGKGDYVRLIFHCGAKTKAALKTRLIEDPARLLTWPSNDRAILRIDSMEDLEAKKANLIDLVRRWIAAAEG